MVQLDQQGPLVHQVKEGIQDQLVLKDKLDQVVKVVLQVYKAHKGRKDLRDPKDPSAQLDLLGPLDFKVTEVTKACLDLLVLKVPEDQLGRWEDKVIQEQQDVRGHLVNLVQLGQLD